jgi:hypothetical protein
VYPLKSVHVLPTRWSAGSQILQRVKPTVTVLARARSNLLDWTIYSLIVTRQRLGKHDPAVKKNLLEASFSVRAVSHERKIGDCYLPERFVDKDICNALKRHEHPSQQRYKQHPFPKLNYYNNFLYSVCLSAPRAFLLIWSVHLVQRGHLHS